ncbi:MAG: hypothetical protein AAGE52_23345 [Myxococcota bacterium]
MNRSILALVLVAAQTAVAQNTSVRPPSGAVTGLELSVEGALVATPGTRARWLLAAHEVVRDREYEPAAGARIRAVASFQQNEPVGVIETDRYGRGTIEFLVPEDLERDFELVLDVASDEHRLQRRFRLMVSVETERAIEFHVTQAAVGPGDPIGAFGRLLDHRGRGVANETCSLLARADDMVVWGPEDVRTDRSGAFAAVVEVGLEPRPIRLALTCGEASATQNVQQRRRPDAPVRVFAAPRRPVVQPGGDVPLDVMVRDRWGRPLSGALVSGPTDSEGRRVSARTGGNGRAVLAWTVPATAESWAYQRLEVEAVAPGLGEGSWRSWVRVAPATFAIAAVAESNAAIVGVPTKVYVRAVRADGGPAAGESIALQGARVGTHQGEADEDGIAVFEVRLSEEEGPPDACGGASAVAVELRVANVTQATCLPVDPDGTVRVRAGRSEGGIAAAITRRGNVAREPVLLTLLRRDPQRDVPIAQTVLAADQDRHTWPSVDGERFLVRARPLMGAAGTEVRGGMAMVRSTSTGSLAVSMDGDEAILSTPVANAHTLLLAMEPRDALRATRSLEVHAPQSPLAQEAELAAGTPLDLSVPAVLRGRAVVTLPALENPTAVGVLRDPWRQRARYRSGRLALVIRAIEAYVADADPEDVVEVVRGRRRFNRAILDAVAGSGSLGPEGARDLGGLPLTMDALEAMDPSFTVDRVAQRITRGRLLRSFVALRSEIVDRNLDLAFARRSSPDQWLRALRDRVGEDDLVDGWGTPLEVRRVRGARGLALEVVAGWELVSAGPDRRFGTRDDVRDPTARLVPQGSLYAEATDEDGLLARLRGAVLGRVTLSELTELLGREAPEEVDSSDEAPSGFAVLPAPVIPHPSLDLLTNTRAMVQRAGTDRQGLSLPSTPAAYTVVLVHGGSAATTAYRRVSPVEIVAPWPEWLREGERLHVRAQALGFEDVEGVRLVVEGENIDATTAWEPRAIRAGEAFAVEIQLTGRERGEGTLRLRAEDASGAVHWRQTFSLPVRTPGARRTLRAASFVTEDWRPVLALPENATGARTRLIATPPGAFHHDPLVRRWRHRAASLQGWAAALAGDEPEEALVPSYRSPDALPAPLRVACGMIALAARGNDDDAMLLRRLRTEFVRSSSGLESTTMAAIVAALSPIAERSLASNQGDDVSRRVSELRTRLWNTKADHPDRPALWARAAAALLLADSEDASGQALWLAAKERLEDAPRGGRWLAHDDPREALAGTAAFLIASKILGDDAPAVREALGSRAWLLLEEPSERSFWLLASSSFGSWSSPATEVRVGDRRVALDQPAVVALGASTNLRMETNGALLARVRVDYQREVSEVEGPAAITLEGDPGRASTGAAFEVVVRTEEALGAPVVLIELPAPALVSPQLRAQMTSDGDVQRVSAPDAAGMMRVHLRSLSVGAEARFPLPIQWTGAGAVRGLAIAIYDESAPWRTASVPARELRIDP